MGNDSSITSSQPPLFHTADEVADLLRTSRAVVYGMNQKNLIPGATRIGRRLLFRRDRLLKWLRDAAVASPSGDERTDPTRADVEAGPGE